MQDKSDTVLFCLCSMCTVVGDIVLMQDKSDTVLLSVLHEYCSGGYRSYARIFTVVEYVEPYIPTQTPEEDLSGHLQSPGQ